MLYRHTMGMSRRCVGSDGQDQGSNWPVVEMTISYTSEMCPCHPLYRLQGIPNGCTGFRATCLLSRHWHGVHSRATCWLLEVVETTDA